MDPDLSWLDLPLDDWQRRILHNIFKGTFKSDNYATPPSEPRKGYIDAGFVLAGVIVLKDVSIAELSWDEAHFLDEMVFKWNIEYSYDMFKHETRIRSRVPCITMMEM